MLDGIIPLAMLGSVNEMISNLGSGFTVKGVVSTTGSLPGTGSLGDLYLVSGEGYASYVWDGSAWQLKAEGHASNNDIDSALYS